MLERIQKIISSAGVASRRAAEQLIAEGRVRVNGQVVTELGSKADPSRDHIKVDGKLINPKQPQTYIMLNKPAGYVTTMSDPEGRPTVQDLLRGVKVRVYPVGRLDYNTEGMLILTNDGDFAHLITHPSHEFPKTYLVKVKGVLDDRQIGELEAGIYLEDGKTAPAKIRKVRKEEANSWVEITIHEGRKRQVRRMFDRIGRSVIKLKRIRTGSLVLGDLPEGTFRHLTSEEVRSLRDSAGKQEMPVLKKEFDRPQRVDTSAGRQAAAKQKLSSRAQRGSGIPRHGISRLSSGGKSASPRTKRTSGRTEEVPGGRVANGSLRLRPGVAPISGEKRARKGQRPDVRPWKVRERVQETLDRMEKKERDRGAGPRTDRARQSAGKAPGPARKRRGVPSRNPRTR